MCTVKFGCSNNCESCGYKFKTIAMTEPLLPSTFYNFIAKEIGLTFILLCFFNMQGSMQNTLSMQRSVVIRQQRNS